MMNWNKFYLVRTKAVLLQWIIRLPNVIIPFGTQHRPNATWIMEAGSCFQLCSIDFWQVCSYRWLNFSIMIRELSAKESLDWVGGEVGMEELFCLTLRFVFSRYFYSDLFFNHNHPSGLMYEKWLMHWMSTICIRFVFTKWNCHKKSANPCHCNCVIKWSDHWAIWLSHLGFFWWADKWYRW